MKNVMAVVLVFITFATGIEAATTIKKGKKVYTSELATKPPQEHFRLGVNAMGNQNWAEALRQFHIVSFNFPDTPYGKNAFYYQGVANYNLEEYDTANEAFSKYLKYQENPQHFEEAIEYKFAIAELYRQGAKRHLLGTRNLPKWQTGRTIALNIYDEVIAALPSHELGAQACYAKGALLKERKEYKDAVESLQMLVRRFPKHELAPESYLLINKIYLAESRIEFQNSDLLALAEINLQRFEEEFPKDERIEESKRDLLAIKEVYATGLYETAQFYEKIRQPRASILYYQKVVKEFPETHVSQQCMQRLWKLNPSFCRQMQDRIDEAEA